MARPPGLSNTLLMFPAVGFVRTSR